MIIVFSALITSSLFIAIYLNYNYNQPPKYVLKAQVDSSSRLDLDSRQRLEQLLLFGDTWKETQLLPLQVCISLPLLSALG